MPPKFMQPLVQKFFFAGTLKGWHVVDRRTMTNILYGQIGGKYRVVYFIGSQYVRESKESGLVEFIAPKCRFHTKVMEFNDFAQYCDCVSNYKASTEGGISKFDHNYIHAMCMGKRVF